MAICQHDNMGFNTFCPVFHIFHRLFASHHLSPLLLIFYSHANVVIGHAKLGGNFFPLHSKQTHFERRRTQMLSTWSWCLSTWPIGFSLELFLKNSPLYIYRVSAKLKYLAKSCTKFFEKSIQIWTARSSSTNIYRLVLLTIRLLHNKTNSRQTNQANFLSKFSQTWADTLWFYNSSTDALSTNKIYTFFTAFSISNWNCILLTKQSAVHRHRLHLNCHFLSSFGSFPFI